MGTAVFEAPFSYHKFLAVLVHITEKVTHGTPGHLFTANDGTSKRANMTVKQPDKINDKILYNVPQLKLSNLLTKH